MAALFGLLLLAAGPTVPRAQAIINPRFTPRDLIKGASQVLVLRVALLPDKTVAAEVVETLKGKAPAAKKLELRIGADLEEEDVKAAFGNQTATAAVLLLSDKAAQAGDDPVGALQIETTWFGVVRDGGKLALEKDPRDLFAVWAGSARMLAAATRYVQQEPAAEFPVRSDMAWGESLKLGQLAGPASGCLIADLGKPAGHCVLVLSPAGDRIYRVASKGAKPTDATAQLKLATASRIAVPGDFDGDGRTDLLSWDGQTLELATLTPAGTFAAPRPHPGADATGFAGARAHPGADATGFAALKACGALAECLSLDCVDAGAPRPTVVAGTSRGPVLLAWDAGGTLQARPLGPTPTQETLARLGPGGLCVVADFNGSGRPDVLALFSRGALFYAAAGAGVFRAPLVIDLPLVDRPCAALCGDYDADGLLDVLVAGRDGLALMSRESPARWSNVTPITGELAYHGNANQPQVTACAPCDVNTDGRQGMALFYADRKPLLFFNRGFACFGWARELDLDPAGAMTEPGAGPRDDPVSPPQPAAATTPDDLKQGQATGAITDLDGDGIPDMLAAGAKGREVWAVFGHRAQGPSRLTCTLALPPSALGPTTVTVRDEKRVSGMYLVRPGIPACVGRAEAGPMIVAWVAPNGKRVQREVVVVDEGTRLEIKPDAAATEEP